MLASLVVAVVLQAVCGHSSNWAVLVSTSKYWFNYRHIANTLSLYRTVKRLGIPDSNIILMVAEDVACNPRNIFPGSVYNMDDHALDLYGDSVEVDYRGDEVSVQNLIRLLVGRHEASVPRSKRLLSNEDSNVFVFISGHGGDEFIKFQDHEELTAWDLADSIHQMSQKRRYGKFFLMVETCEAATLYSKIHSPNVLACSSSIIHEKSYSYGNDFAVGLALIDRYTFFALEFMEKVRIDRNETLWELFQYFYSKPLGSTFHYRLDLFPWDVKQVKVVDFFGYVVPVEIVKQEITIQDSKFLQLPEQDWNIHAQNEEIQTTVSNIKLEEDVSMYALLDKYTQIIKSQKFFWNVIAVLSAILVIFIVKDDVEKIIQYIFP